MSDIILKHNFGFIGRGGSLLRSRPVPMGQNLGESFGGGIVAYILLPGDPGYISGEYHGIIIAPYDQSAGVVWDNGTPQICVTSEALMSGMSNTNKIVAIHGTGTYAARLCYDLTIDGYSDWCLPSRYDLEKMWFFYHSTGIGDFVNANYWSSSEEEGHELNYAYLRTFINGDESPAAKGTYWTRVRAVRYY